MKTNKLLLFVVLVGFGVMSWVKADVHEDDFIRAAAAGDVSQLVDLAEEGVNINAVDGNGNTALMWAAKTGHEVSVRVLLGKGANVTLKNNAGKDALALAKGSAIKDLLKGYASAKKLSKKWKEEVGKTREFTLKQWEALTHAARKGKRNEVARLLAQNKYPERVLTSAFADAINTDHFDVAELLIEKGANPEFGLSFISSAAGARFLLKKGVRFEILDRFLWVCSLETLKMVFDNIPDLSTLASKRTMGLVLFNVMQEHLDIAINHPGKPDNLLCKGNMSRVLALINEFVQRGAIVDQAGWTGESVLDLARKLGDPKILALIEEAAAKQKAAR